MFAALFLDHRLALLFLCLLVIGAAIPLAFAWVRVLPEDPPPFGRQKSSSVRSKNIALGYEVGAERRDPFAIALLLCITISFALQLPGLPMNRAFRTLPTVIPQETMGRLEFGLVWFLISVPALAALYSLIRPNFLRTPLIAAGVSVLLLWLLGAPLYAALTAAS